MVWKRVAWAGCLAPALAGCNIAYYTARNALNEPVELCDQLSRTHHLRKEARAAWAEVRRQYPRKAFTAEFRNGFIDGYTDYLDRGGNGSPPAAPPKRYTRNDYMTPEGHERVKDYFLGFKYGIDVALASGHRQFLTVPLIVPDKEPGPPAFNIQPHGEGSATPLHPPRPVTTPPTGSITTPPDTGAGPLPQPRPAGPDGGAPAAPPKSEPVPPTKGNSGRPTPTPRVPTTPPQGGTARDLKGSKFEVPPRSPVDEGVLPAPTPPLPLPGSPVSIPERLEPVPGTPAAEPLIKLPEPPSEVPNIPDHLPTPSVLDELPVIPATHEIPPPLPATHSIPQRN